MIGDVGWPPWQPACYLACKPIIVWPECACLSDSLYLNACLCLCLTVYLSVHLKVCTWLSLCLFLSVSLPVCLSARLCPSATFCTDLFSLFESGPLTDCLFVCVCLSHCLSVCLPGCARLCLPALTCFLSLNLAPSRCIMYLLSTWYPACRTCTSREDREATVKLKQPCSTKFRQSTWKSSKQAKIDTIAHTVIQSLSNSNFS